MYLDYAENQAARQQPMRMADWVEKLDGFLRFNEYEILTNAGEVIGRRGEGSWPRASTRGSASTRIAITRATSSARSSACRSALSPEHPREA